VDGNCVVSGPLHTFLRGFQLICTRTSFLVGIPSTVITISLPQKYQAVYGDTPFQAGYRLIAYTVLVPFGSIVFNTVLAKTRIPPIYLLFVGSILQNVGPGLMLTIPATGAIPGQIYFFEMLVAIGVGGNFALLVVLNPHAIEKKYMGKLRPLNIVCTY
jgi:hypothetical protein